MGSIRMRSDTYITRLKRDLQDHAVAALFCAKADPDQVAVTIRDFMSTRPAANRASAYGGLHSDFVVLWSRWLAFQPSDDIGCRWGFTEGFETRDLMEAKALLDALAAS
jgi:hypothetical protein